MVFKDHCHPDILRFYAEHRSFLQRRLLSFLLNLRTLGLEVLRQP